MKTTKNGMTTIKQRIIEAYQTLTRPPSYREIALKLKTDKGYVAKVIQAWKITNEKEFTKNLSRTNVYEPESYHRGFADGLKQQK